MAQVLSAASALPTARLLPARLFTLRSNPPALRLALPPARRPAMCSFHVQGKLHTVDHPGGFSASDLHTLLAGAGLSGIQVNVAHRCA